MMGNRAALDRLSSAYRVEVDEATRDRHITEMSAALRTVPAAPIPKGFALRRRFAGAVAAVLVVAAPVGMAVAAEDSLPGEFLYPLKQVTERVRAFVDGDVAATHRVEEAERLLIRGAPLVEITLAVERAEIATSELVEDATLGPRLESIRERLRKQEDQEPAPAEREKPKSGQQDTPGSGAGYRDPSGDQHGADTGSATTSLPGSGGQVEGGGAGSKRGDPTPSDSSPTYRNAGTGADQPASGTPEGDGGTEGDESPRTTARQGSNGGTGS